ncbi:hypothetical protein EVAR_95260_1 [Eumeta japonica]|uniref:Uncharacterized protein n=1 Tax=Eumeta variegata TaxID=151549 RepID=A0A4C1UJZ4_EUMVA|nr:hypothetical protein EVAR_95260_1 [Eumeta japonica]
MQNPENENTHMARWLKAPALADKRAPRSAQSSQQKSISLTKPKAQIEYYIFETCEFAAVPFPGIILGELHREILNLKMYATRLQRRRARSAPAPVARIPRPRLRLLTIVAASHGTRIACSSTVSQID